MKILIIGAGIGGIATALALRNLGIGFEILEQAPALTAVGAGIQLSPNGVRVLRSLGIGDELARFCVKPKSHLFKDWQSGETLLETPLAGAVEATFQAPYYHAHRADLLAALTTKLNNEGLRLNCQVQSVEQDADGRVSVVLRDGERVSGDIVIGADGLHSVVRNQLFAPEQPRYSGHIAWRGLVPAEVARKIGFETYSYIWMGPMRSMVLYYVSGGAALNWVAMTPSPENWQESWSATGAVDDVLSAYQGWHPTITDVIAATATPFVTAIYDRDPLPHWCSGNAVLLGDAAHAMLPYHAQGAVQSLEDAWILARCIAEISQPATAGAALRRYETLRRERTTRVQQQSRAAQSNFHAHTEADVAARNKRFRQHAATVQQQDFPPGQVWLYSYDAESAVIGDDTAWQQKAW